MEIFLKASPWKISVIATIGGVGLLPSLHALKINPTKNDECDI